MKQIIYMISLFLLFVSCSDFLDYKDIVHHAAFCYVRYIESDKGK